MYRIPETTRVLQVGLWAVFFVGAIAMASLPVARGHHPGIGWMPLWLLGMPLASLLALGLSRRREAMRVMPQRTPHAVRHLRPRATLAERRNARRWGTSRAAAFDASVNAAHPRRRH